MNDATTQELRAPPGLVRAESCQQCKFAVLAPGNVKQRQCRRNPPTAAHIMIRAGQFMTYTGFPVVQPDNWCGEFRPKIEGMS